MKDKFKETLSNILAYLLKVERRTLLWTNPSPTSDFGTQPISLDASAYDELEIYYTDYKAHNDIMPALRVSVGQAGSMNAFFGGSTYDSGVVFVANRRFAVTSTYVSFGNGNGSIPNNGWSTRNDMCIPQKIYGIKSGGGTA